MNSKEVKTWYVGVWLSEVEDNQKEIDKGEFQGTVTFEVVEPIEDTFVESVLVPNASSDEAVDFSKTSEQTGTNGIYVWNGDNSTISKNLTDTVNDDGTYPIYYYRGKVDNNLIFADFC